MRRTLYGASKDERIAARYIPKNSHKVALKDGSATVYLSQLAGKFYAIGYRGTAAKSEFHHAFRTEQQRREHVLAFFKSVQQSQELRAQMRREAFKPNTLKVGDILYTSWGYDQTNVDFFVVTRVSGQAVWVRPIAQESESTGFMSGKCWPAMPINPCGDETKHIVRHGNQITIDGHSAWLEDGRAHYFSSYA